MLAAPPSELSQTLLSGDSAVCPACGTLNTRGTLPMPAMEILLYSTSIMAPAFSKKSVPSGPDASAGSG